MSRDFDWSDDDVVICPAQPALAVYRNARGQAVLRQEACWPDDEDHVVLINRETVIGIAYALLDTLEGAFEITERVEHGWCDVPRPERPTERHEPEPEAEPLALPAPDHKREAVAPDLFSETPNGRA